MDTNGSLFILVEALLLAGSLIMLLSILSGRKIMYHVNKKYHRRWKILLWLMVFFFGCYILSFVAVRYKEGHIRLAILPLIIGIVFFAGSIFVYLVVRIGYHTIKDMETSINELKEAVEKKKNVERKLSRSRNKLIRQNHATYYLTQNILKESTLQESLRLLSEKVAEVLRISRVAIWFFDESGELIRCSDLYECESKAHFEGETFVVKDFPTYFNAIEKTAIDAYDVFTDPRTSEYIDTYFAPRKITSILDMPIYIEGKLKGILCNEHRGSTRKWTIEEQSFASSVADIIAITVETFERRKTEKELERALSLARATIESTADGILVVGVEGQISGYNQQFVQMWQIPQEVADRRDDKQALDYVLSQLVEPEKFLAKVQELYANPDKDSFDLLDFKDGRCFERFSKPQRAQNEIIGRVWSFRDITRQKRDEEEIRKLNTDLEERVRVRTQEVLGLNDELKLNVKNLEMANKELESFSFSVSHDLRAPLRAINGFINILEKNYGDACGAEAKTYITSISKNAKKMGQLIDDLLAFSRIGKKDLEKEKIDTNDLVTEIIAEMNIYELNPKTRVIKDELLPLVGDRNLVKQAFYNIIANAVKYSHTKDEPVVEISSHKSGQENVYVVKDNGVGFSMEYYNKLFKVFQRLNSSPDFEGVGVGLAIVERIVSRHGGKVWAESKENEGATFYMAFPNNVEPSPLPPPSENDKADVKKPEAKK